MKPAKKARNLKLAKKARNLPQSSATSSIRPSLRNFCPPIQAARLRKRRRAFSGRTNCTIFSFTILRNTELLPKNSATSRNTRSQTGILTKKSTRRSPSLSGDSLRNNSSVVAFPMARRSEPSRYRPAPTGVCPATQVLGIGTRKSNQKNVCIYASVPRLFYFILNLENPETSVPGHFSQQRNSFVQSTYC